MSNVDQGREVANWELGYMMIELAGQAGNSGRPVVPAIWSGRKIALGNPARQSSWQIELARQANQSQSSQSGPSGQAGQATNGKALVTKVPNSRSEIP